jgi:hypothetical protein
MLRRTNLQIKFEAPLNICLSIRRNISEDLALNDASVKKISNMTKLCIFEIYILLLLVYLSCVRKESKLIRSDCCCVSCPFQRSNSGTYVCEIWNGR